MRPIGPWRALALVVALWTLAPTPVLAAFGDCAAEGFFDPVDDRMAAVALSCDEAERFEIRTPLGTRTVRIVYDSSDARSSLAAQVAAIRRGIERSAAALLAVGEGTTHDITVWASGLSFDRGADGEVEGEAGRAGEECLIAAYDLPDLARVLAHEFFHCVQFATFGTEKTRLSASTWWVEGGAEWFADLAYPGSGASDAYVAGFDAATNRTALTAMEYESVVFFFWLSQTFGATMPMALQAAMPSSGGAGNQQAALAGFLAPEDFQTFAEAYADRRIRQAGGRAIASEPTPAHIFVWTESHSHEVRAPRFAVVFEHLEFDCGTWSTRHEGDSGRWQVSRDEGAWEDLPPRLEVAEPGPETIRLAGLATAGAGFAADIEASRNPCRQCRERVARGEDAAACLVGTWSLESGGYGAQIQERLRETGLFEEMDYPMLEPVLVIAPDGTFQMPPAGDQYRAAVADDDGDIHVAFGPVSMESGGFWSVDGDVFHTCETTSRRTRIDLTLIDPDGASGRLQTEGQPSSGGISRSRSFACSDDTLVLLEEAAFAPSVTWTYRRGE